MHAHGGADVRRREGTHRPLGLLPARPWVRIHHAHAVPVGIMEREGVVAGARVVARLVAGDARGDQPPAKSVHIVRSQVELRSRRLTWGQEHIRVPTSKIATTPAR